MHEKPTYEELEQQIQELEQLGSKLERAEIALRQSDEKYKNIVENIEDGYYEVDIAGNFTFQNNALCKMLGYSKNELTGLNNRRYMDEENAKKIFKAFNRVYKTGQPYKEFGWELIRKDGSKCYVETSIALKRDSKGQPIGFQGIARDVSDRRQVEEKLKESDERYRGLFERSLDLVYLCDFEGKFIDANDAALEELGYTKKEIKSLTFLSLLDKDQLPRAIESVEEILKTGSQDRIAEFRLKRKDGEHIYIESKGALIYRGGNPHAIQGIARNITERKKLEEEKEKVIIELKQALTKVKQLGGLLPICSHCKKIRDDKGYWNQIEAYIQDHSDAEFSHSICQECAKIYYPDMDIYGDEQPQG